MPDGENHLSEQPVPETSRFPRRNRRFRRLLFGLAPDGVFRAFGITPEAVGSYPAFSPLPLTHSYSGGIFSVALSVEKPYDFPPVSISASQILSSLSAKLHGIAPCGVRTFLPGFSPGAILRLAKINGSLPEDGDITRPTKPLYLQCS